MSGLHKDYIRRRCRLPNEGRLAEFESEARESLGQADRHRGQRRPAPSRTIWPSWFARV